jgi:hypothetical protein
VVNTVGLTITDALLEPVFQVYPVPPVAVNVVLDPVQIKTSLPASALIVLIVTATSSDAVHPFPPVAVTV